MVCSVMGDRIMVCAVMRMALRCVGVGCVASESGLIGERRLDHTIGVWRLGSLGTDDFHHAYGIQIWDSHLSRNRHEDENAS